MREKGPLTYIGLLVEGTNPDIHISESQFGPGHPVGVREGELGRLPFFPLIEQ